MANTTKSRKDLKSYFVKNSIPTQSNFADLIDGMLNQQDDGIIKVAGDPLKITADDSQGLQKVINFYEKIEDANPAWSLQLNPRTDTKVSSTAKAGFCVADSQSIPRLFIDKATGNLGIGTLSPIAPLDIAQVPRQANDLPNHPQSIKGLYITGDFGEAEGIEFRHTNGTQGIGFGFATIYAAGSNPDQVLQLKPKGAAALRVLGKANLSPGNDENDFSLEDSMESGSLTIGSVSKSYGGQNGQFFNLAGLLLQTNGKTEIAVYHPGKRFSSLMYYEGGDAPLITIGRDMGTASDWRVTPVNIASNLTVNGNLIVSGSITNANDDNQWITPTLQPGLNNYGNTFNPVQFRKDGDGVVWLRGLVRGATVNSVIFSLPAGYHPTYRQLHCVCTSPDVIGRVDVLQDGSVLLVLGSNDWVSLDGIAFRASPVSSTVTPGQHW